jgi:hypothetical protein
MSKYEENSKLLSDLKGLPKNIVEMAVAGANRNLKLSEYYVLGSHSQIYDEHIVKKEIAPKNYVNVKI